MDAALHANALVEQTDGDLRLPFTWSGVTLHATGATALRVRLTTSGADKLSLSVADPHGMPVATVRSLTTRPIGDTLRQASRGALRDSLFQVAWTAVPTDGESDTHATWALLGDDTGSLVRTVGGASQLITPHGDVQSLVAAIDSSAPGPSAIAVASVSQPGVDPLTSAHRVTEAVLTVVQDFLHAET